MKMTKYQMNQARELARIKGGFREKYAMNNGKEEVININGHICFKYTYSENENYQDANGATYDINERKWIN